MQFVARYEPTVATDRQDYYNRGGPSVLGTSDSVHAKEALAPLTEVSAGGQGTNDPVHAKDALAPLTEVPAEGKGIVETVMEYLPGHGHAAHDVRPTFLLLSIANVHAMHQSHAGCRLAALRLVAMCSSSSDAKGSRRIGNEDIGQITLMS